MSRVAGAVKGMRVVTPLGRIARVEGVALQTSYLFQRVHLRYYDDQSETVALQAKLLKPYVGDPIIFRDETDGLRMKHGDVPLPPPGGIVKSAPPAGVVRPSPPANLPFVAPRPAGEGQG